MFNKQSVLIGTAVATTIALATKDFMTEVSRDIITPFLCKILNIDNNCSGKNKAFVENLITFVIIVTIMLAVQKYIVE